MRLMNPTAGQRGSSSLPSVHPKKTAVVPCAGCLIGDGRGTFSKLFRQLHQQEHLRGRVREAAAHKFFDSTFESNVRLDRFAPPRMLIGTRSAYRQRNQRSASTKLTTPQPSMTPMRGNCAPRLAPSSITLRSELMTAVSGNARMSG